MSSPLVSLLTSSYNQEGFIGETIESALNQTYENWELVIIDDCSTDGTWEIISSYVKRDKRIHATRNVENAGLVANWQTLIGKTSGEYVAFLEGDDTFTIDNLEKRISVFGKHAEVGLVYSDLNLINTASEQMQGSYYKKYGIKTYTLSPIPVADFLASPLGLMVTYSQVMVRRSVFDTAGLPRSLDGEKSFLPSDWDFNQRVSEQSHVFFVNVPLLNYRKHNSNGGSNTPKVTRQMDCILDDIQARYNEDENVLRLIKEKRAKQRYFLAVYFLEQGKKVAARKEYMKAIHDAPALLFKDMFSFLKVGVRLFLPVWFDRMLTRTFYYKGN